MSDPRITGRAPIKMVEAYWEGLRNGRLMPNRAEVQSRGLGAALENAFVLERVANGFARMRVAGQCLNDLMGMETRGMPVSALFMPEDRTQLSDALEAVFSEPAQVRLTLTAPGSPDIPAEALFLPLRSDLGDVTRALGCLIYDSQIADPPRRFHIETQERRTLTGFADLPVRQVAAPARVPEGGFAESAAPFSPPPRRQAGPRSHLRLVKSDDD